MSTPGWYPDPSGAPGRFRFWDGDRWSDQTTASPRTTPTPAASGPAGAARRRGDRGWIVGLVVLLAVTLVAVVAFLVWGTRDPLGGGATEDTNSSTPTVSGWDETSTPTPPRPSGGGEMVACPTTRQNASTTQQAGKLTADTLQVDPITGWDSYSFELGFTYDGHWQYTTVYNAGIHGVWMSDFGVARVSKQDGFTDPATAAERIMECYSTSQYYDDFTQRIDLVNEAITVNGHPGWRIRAEIHIDSPWFPVDGDVTDVIVVDLGSDKDHLGLFTSCYTIGDTQIQPLIDAARASLTVLG